MAKRSKGQHSQNSTVSEGSLAAKVAGNQIKTSDQFKNVFSALVSDVLNGRQNAVVSNAACNAGSKLLKVVELEFRYGKKVDGAAAPLQLSR